MIGGHELLGAWNLEKSVQLNWSPGDVWVVRAPLPVASLLRLVALRNKSLRPHALRPGGFALLSLTWHEPAAPFALVLLVRAEQAG